MMGGNQVMRHARRAFVVVLIVAILIALAGVSPRSAAAATDPCATPANQIVVENCLPGSPASQWDVTGSGDASIQGFATDFSLNPGATEHFKIATDASAYTIDIYRIGFYGGDGARFITSIAPSASLPQTQPPCLNDAATGLIDCGNWTESASWNVPATAVSGVYFAKLTRSDTNGASQIPFVVRDDTSHSALLFQTSDTTWQAYNDYGGNSLYTGAPGTNPGRAYKVSYNRPFATRGDDPEDFFFNAEYPMVRWLEQNGYDVSYISGIDTDRGGATLLEQHKVFMSVGHDEYWSGNQRANVEAAQAAGVDLAFFSGNQIFWKTRWEPSIDGSNTDYRTLVSYKETHGEAKIDPTSAWTGTWRDPLGAGYDAGRPENGLAGTIFMVNSGTFAIQVPASDAGLRLWRDTRVANLESGSATLGTDTLGYEWNEDLDNGSRPPGEIDLSSTTESVPEVLQDAGSTYGPGTATHSVTLHRAASGALVFDVGSIQWSWGLDGNHDRGGTTPDSAMQQATVNVFADMGVQPATLQSGLVAATQSTDTTAPTSSVTSPAPGDTVLVNSPVTVNGTAVDGGGGHVAGVEVSTDNGATWHPATGHDSWSYTFKPTAVGSLAIESRATDDSVNTGSPSSAVNVTVAPHGCPCSIWDNSVTPAKTGLNDNGGSIDYGVKFRSDADGSITGFRFYKSAGDTGTHIGQLWTTAGGTPLATATFTNETASGWQQVALSSPVSINANTTYVASIYSSNGVYSDNNNYFTGFGLDNPPLHALQSGVDGLNGVFQEGNGQAFPNQSFQDSNYWADVVFSNGPDTTPPVITSRSPASGSSGVAVLKPVTATFDEAMDATTISASTFVLHDSSNATIPASVSYDASNFVATLTPSMPLSPSSQYTATMSGTVTDAAGNPLGSDVSWNFTTADAPPDSGPGGPILVIGSTANPFGRYLGEILSNEGLNEYRITDITNVTPTVLGNYDVVVLGDMPLTGAQASMLTTWVNGGGKLIAMRPDAQLAGVLGVTKTNGTMLNAYVGFDTTRSPGQGLTDQTVQYHGAADEYQLTGATSLATLYSDATTRSTFPAVTLANAGASGGQAAAFAYDLARSVVYTRQGNPAWSGQERDGTPPIRSDDLFFGNAASDHQPDWVDLNKVAIPQADEQQRLLANLILQMDVTKPLPRFWYLPRGAKAAVVMTGDDHANGGTAGRFDEEINDSPAGCNVANWGCIRSTSYIYPGTPLTDAQTAMYQSAGFEIGLHPTTDCTDWTPTSLANVYTSQLAQWHADYPSLNGPFTSRTHCIVESDYSTQPHIELANGIRLDTNYYYWPQSWIQDRPGMFTGSGMPMRFADADGSAIDVYQATTQMTDESGQSYPFTINTLLDNALGSLGYYGVFTANMHNDNATSAGADAIIASAQSRHVPIVSSRQMLDWLDGRNGSSFSALTWNNHTLTFAVNQAATANGLQGMLPMSSADGSSLTSITRGGSNVSFTTATIKGVSYALFDAAGGNYTAIYPPDTTPPVISGLSATATTSGNATVSWTTDEPSTSNVNFGTASNALNVNAGNTTLVRSHVVTLQGLTPGTTYFYRVSSVDRAGNIATSPSAPVSFTVPTFVANDTTVADFASGTPGTCAAVAHSGDGEVELGPTVENEFSGSGLPPGFFSAAWGTPSTATVAGGQLVLDNARAGTSATFSAGHSLEFVATFGSEPFQHVGFGTDFNAGPWAIFSTGTDGTSLKARTNDGSNETDTTLSASLLGSPHDFRIDWTSSQIVYWVDGVQVATHSVAIGTPMRPLASDAQSDATNVSVDWMQMTPYGGTCTFMSRTIDAGQGIGWLTLEPAITTPANTSVTFDTRTSLDATNWTAWTAVSGTTIKSVDGRYLQYRANLSTTDATATPLVNAVKVTGDALPAAATGVVSVPGSSAASVSWNAPASDGSPINAYIVTPYKAGVAQTPLTFASTATSQTIGGLTNGASYTFTVTTKNGSGAGPASRPSNASNVGAPLAPTGATAKAGSGSATVSWTAPSSDNGSPITGYVVTPYVGFFALPPRRYNSTALQQTVTGLQSGTSYRFTVVATNARGDGAGSLLSNSVSPK
jgi:hypothetical protein